MVLKSHQEGAHPQQIGRCFDIHRSTFFRWKQAKYEIGIGFLIIFATLFSFYKTFY
ncbi:helix-turn-helix domain-containing protein [Aggregatibacter actinomycetemcomitans]|uniref:helix-turn-helix domain-containing protein n=1 Tax=Aggregatibacter actinomycetemcomitans TaxID=714 RepID=UPI00197C3F7D|nr:helix-turn-helix domain-containing protein [Aggregatibacter actinomycetemcomitans]MBN6086717.1 helix-turn-helix domain-containing protein [Aggregatibacter actinomycetemcomitans]